MKLRLCIFLALSAALSTPGGGAPADPDYDALFDQAAAYYDSADYVSAISAYQKMVNAGISSPEVFYNLGNAYYKAGMLGKSIASYRRALRLAPDDSDILTNLTFVRQFRIDKLKYPEKSAGEKLWETILSVIDISVTTVIITLAWWAAFLLPAVFILRGKRGKYLLYGAGLAVILLTILTPLLVARASGQRERTEGVLIATVSDIRTGPGDDYTLQFEGHEGLEFVIDEEKGEYYRVTLDNGIKGWVLKKDVEVI